MTQADFHAIALFAVPTAAFLSLLALKRHAPRPAQAIVGVAVSAAAFIFIGGCRHMCNEGQAFTQWLLPGLLLPPALLFVRHPAARWLLGGALILAMAGLHWHFAEIVHEDGWTGNPDWEGAARGHLASFEGCAYEATELQHDVELPPDWLRETDLWPLIREQCGPEPPTGRQIQRAWHSAFTGLYPYHRKPQDLWFPGGRVGEALLKLELRDKPPVPQ